MQTHSIPKMGTVAIIIPLLAVLAFGCTHRGPDSFLDSKRHDPRPQGWPIDVFYGDAKPTKPFTPIRLLRIQGRKDGGSIVAEARSEAREYGGDGVVFSNVRGSRTDTAWQVVPLVSSSGSNGSDVIEAVVIVYDQAKP